MQVAAKSKDALCTDRIGTLVGALGLWPLLRRNTSFRRNMAIAAHALFTAKGLPHSGGRQRRGADRRNPRAQRGPVS